MQCHGTNEKKSTGFRQKQQIKLVNNSSNTYELSRPIFGKALKKSHFSVQVGEY
jgi:hypothetical protein